MHSLMLVAIGAFAALLVVSVGTLEAVTDAFACFALCHCCYRALVL